MGEVRVSNSIDIEVADWAAPNTLQGQGVSKKSQAARNRLIRKVVVVFGVVTLLSLFCVWSRLQVLQMGYENSKLQGQVRELNDTIKRMDVEIARLKSPGYLRSVAEDRLGMHPPRSEQLVIIKGEESGTVGGKTNDEDRTSKD